MEILLADDSTLISEGLYQMLIRYKQIEILVLPKRGIDPPGAIRNLNPDLSIVVPEMPGLSGSWVLNGISKVDISPNHPYFFPIEDYRPMANRVGDDFTFSKEDDFKIVALVVE
jgi:DNA-binding NarL/FixJ family response regulator